MNRINTTSRLAGVFFTGMMIAGNTNAQTIIVPQTAPYTNDANTVLLEHFNGTTSGSANGSVTYTNGVFGQGVHLDVGSWVSWGNLGTLTQATVEFWGNLDTLNYSDTANGPAFIQSDYSQFYASTFSTSIQSTNYALSIYHCGCGLSDNWVGMPNTIETPAFSVTSNTWHHYATTWGNQGFHFYIDGNLVYTNANTEGLNGNTAFWAIGGLIGGGTASSPGFTGVIDELRISKIQRVFASSQFLNIQKAVYLNTYNLLVGSNYQLQISGDLIHWTNYGGVFSATNSYWQSTNYWQVVDWNQLFFRLVPQ